MRRVTLIPTALALANTVLVLLPDREEFAIANCFMLPISHQVYNEGKRRKNILCTKATGKGLKHHPWGDVAAGNAQGHFPPSLTQRTCPMMEAAEVTGVYGRKLQHGPFGVAASQGYPRAAPTSTALQLGSHFKCSPVKARGVGVSFTN